MAFFNKQLWIKWVLFYFCPLFKYAINTCCRSVQKASNFHSMSHGYHSLSKAIPTAEIITQPLVTWKPSRNQFALAKLCLPYVAGFSNLPYTPVGIYWPDQQSTSPFLLVRIKSQPSIFFHSLPTKFVKWLYLKYSKTSLEGSSQCQIWLHWISVHRMSS